MNKMVAMATFLLFVFCFSSTSFAFGNWKTGKAIFKQDCASCHKRGGTAKRIKLPDYTQTEWIKFIRDTPAQQHETTFGNLSPDNKEDLMQYLLKYAQPDPPTILSCAG